MVAGAQSQPQTQQQQPLSAEEEALKRNTDCVYFLASPLTCKKGSECEYRHSEYARVNPRDCWYWLNGNCLNPKCSFRHPPLDGLLGPPQAGGAPSSVQAPVLPVTPATQNPKQAVLCIYFQKGYCLKGDKCAFSHGPTPATSAKVMQAAPAVQVDELSNTKNVFGTIQKCNQEQKITQINTVKSFGGHPLANPVKKVEAALPRNGVSNERNVPAIKSYDDQVTRVKEVNAPVMNGISMTRPNRPHLNVSDDHGFQNGKDTDEFLRESSPGFDVLVEDDVGDQDYFNDEDQYGRSRGHDSRNLNSVDDYDMNPSADYNSAAETDRERFRDQRGYQFYDHRMQGQYGWEKQHRASAERMAAGPTQFYRRDHRKSTSPDDVSGLDLRHRLSKQKRGDSNGLRSVISRDFDDDDRSYRNSSRRDHHKKPEHENPLSNRLRGRINFPVGSSADVRDSRHERERSRGRLSPNRPQASTHQGRLRDRLKGRAHDVGGPDLSLPRSSSKVKGERDFENKEQSHLGKRKSMGVDGSQQSEGDVSFDGPMPLSEILKRKREAKAAASVGGKMQEAKEEGEHSPVLSNNDEPKSFSVDEKIEDPHKLSSVAPNPSELGAEDGAIYDETIDDHEIEGEDQGQGEYEYEQEEEDGEYEENAEGEDEYLEDEDDDFAKKIGVVLS